MTSRRAPGFRVTPRDVAILRWVGRLRIATADQVADRFGLGRAVGYARLSGLARLGLLEHQRIFHAAAGIYLATRPGLEASELDLPPASVDLRTYAHDLELTSLVLELEREFGVDRVATEREMRSSDMGAGVPAAGPLRFAVPLVASYGQQQLTPLGHPRLHFADCAITGAKADDRTLAIELERTAKGRARLRRILTAYVGARHVAGVRYYVTNDRVHSLVDQEVGRLGAGRLVTVERRPGSRPDLKLVA